MLYILHMLYMIISIVYNVTCVIYRALDTLLYSLPTLSCPLTFVPWTGQEMSCRTTPYPVRASRGATPILGIEVGVVQQETRWSQVTCSLLCPEARSRCARTGSTCSCYNIAARARAWWFASKRTSERARERLYCSKLVGKETRICTRKNRDPEF